MYETSPRPSGPEKWGLWGGPGACFLLALQARRLPSPPQHLGSLVRKQDDGDRVSKCLRAVWPGFTFLSYPGRPGQSTNYGFSQPGPQRRQGIPGDSELKHSRLKGLRNVSSRKQRSSLTLAQGFSPETSFFIQLNKEKTVTPRSPRSCQMRDWGEMGELSTAQVLGRKVRGSPPPLS